MKKKKNIFFFFLGLGIKQETAVALPRIPDGQHANKKKRGWLFRSTKVFFVISPRGSKHSVGAPDVRGGHDDDAFFLAPDGRPYSQGALWSCLWPPCPAFFTLSRNQRNFSKFHSNFVSRLVVVAVPLSEIDGNDLGPNEKIWRGESRAARARETFAVYHSKFFFFLPGLG